MKTDVRVITVCSGLAVGVDDLPTKEAVGLRQHMVNANDDNVKMLSDLLSQDYYIHTATPVSTDGWCGVTYLLTKAVQGSGIRKSSGRRYD